MHSTPGTFPVPCMNHTQAPGPAVPRAHRGAALDAHGSISHGVAMAGGAAAPIPMLLPWRWSPHSAGCRCKCQQHSRTASSPGSHRARDWQLPPVSPALGHLSTAGSSCGHILRVLRSCSVTWRNTSPESCREPARPEQSPGVKAFSSSNL